MSGTETVRDALPPDWEAARRWAALMLAVIAAVAVGRVAVGPTAAILAGCVVILVALLAAYVGAWRAARRRAAAADDVLNEPWATGAAARVRVDVLG